MRYSFCICIIIFSALLGSCKEHATEYIVGTGPGEINGFISLRDSINGNEMTPNDSAAIIAIENGSQYTRTDGGQFTLTGVPTGIFTLIFSKPGFAESRDVDHNYKGGSLEYYGTRRLYQIRRLTPNIVLRPFQSVNGADTPYTRALFTSRITDSVHFGEQYSGLIKLYFGKTADISPKVPDSYFFDSPFIYADAQSGIATTYIYRDSLVNNGFHTLEKVYCTAYYCGFYTKNEFYVDKISGKRIYTGLSPFHSESASFIFP
jgi:hypothetical protein